jgi:hypothetical protein
MIGTYRMAASQSFIQVWGFDILTFASRA